MKGLTSSTGLPTVDLQFRSVVDPYRFQRLAQLLFSSSTGLLATASTGAST
jgi:hypothetical protein